MKPAFERYLEMMASMTFDCIQGGIPKDAYLANLKGVVRNMENLLDKKCQHPPETVIADILEGEYESAVQWCRICGAYRRAFCDSHHTPLYYSDWRLTGL